LQTGVIRLRLRPMRSQTRAETTIAWASGNVSVTLRTRIRELVPWDFDGDFDPHRTSLDAPRMVPAPSGILLRRQEKEMKVHVASPEKRTLDFTITNVGLHLMLTAVAAAAIVLGPFSTAPLRAQQSQLTGTGVLDGDWQNVDPNTRGIVEIVIAGRKVHPFGACHPSACDQGVIKAKALLRASTPRIFAGLWRRSVPALARSRSRSHWSLMAGFEPIDSHISQTEAAEPTTVLLTTSSVAGGLMSHSCNPGNSTPDGTPRGRFGLKGSGKIPPVIT